MDAKRHEYFDKLSSSGASEENNNLNKLQIIQQENPNQKIYKFCGIDTALKILESGSVLLQPPDNFNDPYDCLTRVGIWEANTRFEVTDAIWRRIEELTTGLPKKFQPQLVDMFRDLRLSYSYLVTCFSSNSTNHLMWSHYASSHVGVCLEFDFSDVENEIHPCAYFDTMPSVDWQSQGIHLALIKSHHWNYEQEWRLIRESNRPVARVFGSIMHNQIYNNLKSAEERQELDAFTRPIHERIEAEQQSNKTLVIRPTAVIYGASFDRNFSNQNTIATCRRIADVGLDLKIEFRRMVAQSHDFGLTMEKMVKPARSWWDFHAELKAAIEISRMQAAREK